MIMILLFGLQSNASCGMGVAEQSTKTFMELKRKKTYRYVIFKIDENKREVVVEKTGGPAESYDDFTAALPENDCRYAVYDFDFVTSENCQKSKIFFIAWLVLFLFHFLPLYLRIQIANLTLLMDSQLSICEILNLKFVLVVSHDN